MATTETPLTDDFGALSDAVESMIAGGVARWEGSPAVLRHIDGEQILERGRGCAYGIYRSHHMAEE